MGDRFPKATDQAGLLLGGLVVGDRIADYVVDEHLPTRGSGHLYLASHLVLPRRAVIKILPLAVGAARELTVEQLREACIVDAIDHPGVPRLFETGVLPDRRHWVALEHIDGPSLADALDAHAVEDHAVMTIVRDVADVLASVHAQGLVHANVVPSAVVVPTRARRHPLCLVDWGAARTLDSTRPLPLAPPRSSLGYLAPEQLHGKPIDASADVFALGMIARELGADAQSDLPPMFLALVDRMLAVEPAERPTAADVRDAVTWLCTQADDSARTQPVVR